MIKRELCLINITSKIFFILLILINTQIVFSHPYHHSLTIIENGKQKEQLEISLKLLTEDYKKLTKASLIETYISQHLKISINTTPLNLQLLGKEINPEFTWLYLSCDYNSNHIKQVQILNTILLDINDNQINTVKLNVKNQQLSHNFSRLDNAYKFEIR